MMMNDDDGDGDCDCDGDSEDVGGNMRKDF